MRFLTWCLIGCVGSLYGILINDVKLDNAQMTADNLWISYKDKRTSYYFEHGEAEGMCFHSAGKTIKITVDGKDVTKEIAIGSGDADVQFAIPLNRKTVLGDYVCHSDNIYPLHRIRYILCDPNKLGPSKVCPEGQLCVINGDNTSCQRKLDCEGVQQSVECLSGRPAKKTNGSCHVNNIAHKISKDYYLRTENGHCGVHPRAVHSGNVVTFLSTLPISSSRELARGTWNLTHKMHDNLYCVMFGKRDLMRFDSSDFTTAWDGGLPSKVLVRCEFYPLSYTMFHILFYGKNRTRFTIVQKSTNFTVDITNNTNQELLLDSTAPFNCSVSIEGELFVEAFSMEITSTDQPRLGNDSVEMKYNADPNAVYTCIAKVYYYEYFGKDRFKLLYTEKRDFTIYHSTISTKGTTPIATTQTVPSSITTGSTGSGTPGKLIGICIGSILGTIFLVIIVVLAIRAYRKDRMQLKAKEENRPPPFRSVRAPETDRFKSMTVDRSASILSASGLQPSRGSGLIRLIYKEKPQSRKRTGSHGTAGSDRRRSSQGIETRKPSASRRGTGTIEAKIRAREGVGSHGNASSHRRRSSQGTAARGSGVAEKRAGSIDTKTRSASLI